MGLTLQHEGVRHHRFNQGQLQPTGPQTGCKGSAERRAPRCQLILKSNYTLLQLPILDILCGMSPKSHACMAKGCSREFQGQRSAFAAIYKHLLDRMMTACREQSIATAQCAHLCTRPERYAHKHRCSSICRRRQGLLRTIRPQCLPAAPACRCLAIHSTAWQVCWAWTEAAHRCRTSLLWFGLKQQHMSGKRHEAPCPYK